MSHRTGHSVKSIALVVTAGICIAACTGGGRTMRLYDMESGKPLAPETVARISINDMKGFGDRLVMRFDTRDDIIPRDTIEVLPGEHDLHFRFSTPGSAMKLEQYVQGMERSRYCIYFEFVARAGHLYEFRIVDLKFGGGWKVDLVDLTDTTQVVHGSGCQRDKRWLEILEREN